jgi:ketosteroid isomerase-like protein
VRADQIYVTKFIDIREEAMEITRRHLAAGGALTLGTLSLLESAPSFAESAEEAAVDKAVETLRKALLEKDRAQLEELTAAQLSYGHSSGRVETKSQFVSGYVTSKATYKWITFPELTIAVVGDTAIARHLYEFESETDGKTNNVKIGALQVWQKLDGNWKLLARQGFKLA